MPKHEPEVLTAIRSRAKSSDIIGMPLDASTSRIILGCPICHNNMRVSHDCYGSNATKYKLSIFASTGSNFGFDSGEGVYINYIPWRES